MNVLAGLAVCAGALDELLSSWLTHEMATARLRCTLAIYGKDTARVPDTVETRRCI